MSDLAQKTCIPCRGGVPPLGAGEIRGFLDSLGGAWEVVDQHHLSKLFSFPDFKQALDFTQRVGMVAEEQSHHPDIHLSWGKVRIEIWTHKINGLTESDFILAAKCDAVLESG